ncbi:MULTISPECIES: ring-opening amidohydrolase [Variovorax]|uniref:cyanuric acid amidohydrolase n=1 Tax=Variovorax TaxID=34072 RepID=UPI000F7F97F2|nr:ring-opening amidohydrolase [Variovorax sp. 369]RTD91248.1 ring-opening amidohydrolase [Variovorax sp. 369]
MNTRADSAAAGAGGPSSTVPRIQKVSAWRIPCRGPGDLEGVRALIETGELVPSEIVAVMGKTEGNGCVNDFTREYASAAWCQLLAPELGCTPDEVHRRVALVMSGGTEGVLSPHFTVFARRWEPEAAWPPAHAGKRLAVGVAHTRDFLPEEIGRAAQIDATAQAVAEAMRDAGIDSADDVHFVQVKCPLLTSAKVADALSRGAPPATHDSYESMGYSRGASALGVAVALGEAAREAIADASVLADWRLFSARASASAGIELEGNVIIVLGEARASVSALRIAHGVMRDAIDGHSVRALLRDAFGLDAERDAQAVSRRLVNLLAKAEASPDGRVRGERHTMLNDSDIHATRHARAVVGGVLASLAGHTALYVSGGAEHQGPAGGGPVAAIVRVEEPAGAARAESDPTL